MRLLISGTSDPNQLPSLYSHALRNMGVELDIHDPTSAHILLRSKQLSRVVTRLLPSVRREVFERTLLQEADQFRPDVILIFKGMDFSPACLRALRARQIALVCYNADHPFEFAHRGSGNENVRIGIPEYDLYVVYSRHIARQLEQSYPSLRTKVVPFGHNVSDTLYQKCASIDELQRACFVGNADSHRASMIKLLTSAGVPVDIFGFNWQAFRWDSPNVQFRGGVTGHRYFETLAQYRVQLNFFRPHNFDSHNMRTFEVPACGGIMLAPSSAEHESFFKAGEEAFYFDDNDSLVEQALRILALPKEAAALVRKRARMRSTTSGYAYRDRVAQLLPCLEEAGAEARLSASKVVSHA